MNEEIDCVLKELETLSFEELIMYAESTEVNEYTPKKVLEKIADLLLSEDLRSRKSNKSQVTEYPILSEYQLLRRTTGKSGKGRGKSYVYREVPLTNANSVSSTGHNWADKRRKTESYDE